MPPPPSAGSSSPASAAKGERRASTSTSRRSTWRSTSSGTPPRGPGTGSAWSAEPPERVAHDVLSDRPTEQQPRLGRPAEVDPRVDPGCGVLLRGVEDAREGADDDAPVVASG